MNRSYTRTYWLTTFFLFAFFISLTAHEQGYCQTFDPGTGRFMGVPVEPERATSYHFYIHSTELNMKTSREDAIEQTEYISQINGDIQVHLMYQGTNGLVSDLIRTGITKLGIPNSYNKMCAEFYITKLKDNPAHSFTNSVIGKGALTRMMNTVKLLSQAQRERIDVVVYGAAILIPKDVRNRNRIYSSKKV